MSADPILVRLFPMAERDRGREAAELAGSTADRAGVVGYAFRRRLGLGADQALGQATEWAAGPGVVLAGVLAVAAFVLAEWAPWRPGGEQSPLLLGHVGPFLTTGVLVFPVYAAALLAVLAGAVRTTRLLVGLAYAASVAAHVAGRTTHAVTFPDGTREVTLAHPPPPAVLLAVMALLALPALLAPRTHARSWGRPALAGLTVVSTALLVLLHRPVFGSYNERLSFVVDDLAKLGAGFYDGAVPVLLLLALLVRTRRLRAARGVALLLAPWTLSVGLRTGSQQVPGAALLAWGAGTLALCVVVLLLPERPLPAPA